MRGKGGSFKRVTERVTGLVGVMRKWKWKWNWKWDEWSFGYGFLYTRITNYNGLRRFGTPHEFVRCL